VKNLKEQKKYIWFDLGYTLLHLKRDVSFQQILQEMGVSLSADEIEKAFHITDKLFMREYPGVLGKKTGYAMPLYLGNMMYLLGVETDICPLFESWKRELENPLDVWVPYDFVKEELRKLSDGGFRLGVISNWDSSARPILDLHGLTHFFDDIIISSEVGVEKPGVEIFERAFSQASVAPDECLYIGDNYYDDGIGCTKVGMDFVIINPYGTLGVEELKDCSVLPDICHLGKFL